jgi:hypothetical protein
MKKDFRSLPIFSSLVLDLPGSSFSLFGLPSAVIGTSQGQGELLGKPA